MNGYNTSDSSKTDGNEEVRRQKDTKRHRIVHIITANRRNVDNHERYSYPLTPRENVLPYRGRSLKRPLEFPSKY